MTDELARLERREEYLQGLKPICSLGHIRHD